MNGERSAERSEASFLLFVFVGAFAVVAEGLMPAKVEVDGDGVSVFAMPPAINPEVVVEILETDASRSRSLRDDDCCRERPMTSCICRLRGWLFLAGGGRTMMHV
jgi:hypothetical protein